MIRRNHSRRMATTALIGLSLFTASAVLSFSVAHADPVWQEQFGGSNQIDRVAYPESSVVDSHDNVVVAGAITDDSATGRFATVKYDSAGHLLWSQTVNPANGQYYSAPNVFVALDSSDNVSTLSIYAGDQTATLARYSSSGAMYTQATLEISPAALVTVQKIFAESNGDVIVVATGSEDNPDGEQQSYGVIERFDSHGNRLWRNTIFGGNEDTENTAQNAERDAQGNMIVVGDETTDDGTFLYVGKYDPAGNVLYSNVYQDAIDPNAHVVGTSLAIDAAGDAYVGGSLTTSGETQALLLRVRPNGSFMWARHYSLGGSNPYATIQQVVLDHSGNIVAGGYSNDDKQQIYTNYTTARRLLLKYSPTGHRLWLQHGTAYGEEALVGLFTSARTDDLYAVDSLVGNADSGYQNHNAVITSKLDPSGNVENEEIYVNQDPFIIANYSVTAAFDPLLDAVYTSVEDYPEDEGAWLTSKYRLGG